MGRYDLWNLLRGKANSSTEDKFAGGIAHEARFFDLWLIRSLLRGLATSRANRFQGFHVHAGDRGPRESGRIQWKRSNGSHSLGIGSPMRQQRRNLLRPGSPINK